jgi:hypothetical protein
LGPGTQRLQEFVEATIKELFSAVLVGEQPLTGGHVEELLEVFRELDESPKPTLAGDSGARSVWLTPGVISAPAHVGRFADVALRKAEAPGQSLNGSYDIVSAGRGFR